tara:strand:- start:356 stop:616 length:261 start_codon:yes stop_codon:yes gene_type:complete
MFILVDKKTGGVYAVKNRSSIKTVHMFQQKEDAERYMTLLESNNYSKPLELMDIDIDAVAINCEKFGYAYSIVNKDDLIIPPLPKE